MSLPALSHSFGVVYTLPVPFWLYAWGASGALVASFLVVGYFMTVEDEQRIGWGRDLTDSGLSRFAARFRLLPLGKVLSLILLFLCIATGFLGSQNAYKNINMTLFWVVFVLGLTYLTAFVGNVYAALNPWQTLVAVIGRWYPRYGQGVISYPRALAYWPALTLYALFIWVELFAGDKPRDLSVVLIIYTVLNVMGAGLVGQKAWFRYGEFFSVFFRLIAWMAPVKYRPRTSTDMGCLRLRLPFSGLMQAEVQHVSLLLFILFMLSSTAFDGLHETQVWKQIFWVDLYREYLKDWTSTNPLAAFPAMRELYSYWQSFWLIGSPWLYLLVYLFFVKFTQRVIGSSISTRELALHFAPSLLPIALVYHVSHYYTLLQTQGIKVVRLLSDPFGRGANWFGTADWFRGTTVPDLSIVWHVQVILIVFGHIVSVYFAHRLALKIFATEKVAALSQLPMLVLMVLFTTAGLWILSQPMAI